MTASAMAPPNDSDSTGAPSLGNHFCADDNPIIPPEHSWLRGRILEYTPTAMEKEG